MSRSSLQMRLEEDLPIQRPIHKHSGSFLFPINAFIAETKALPLGEMSLIRKYVDKKGEFIYKWFKKDDRNMFLRHRWVGRHCG